MKNNKHVESFEEFNEKLNIFGKKKESNINLGDSKLKNFGLDEFIKQFIRGLDNPIIMSMFYRMLDTNSFTKFGQKIFTFTDEEKEKLEKIKPLLDDLVNTVSKIKNIQNGV
ncbi:MAG: hypothetical protein HPY57_15285 [Ignavibacteria bacterium]|nr:hypothetical protein [Ignavibacteria bacterium]